MRQSRQAITLIETLLVITILGMVVSIAVWSLGAAADESAVNTVVFRWRAFDTNARMLAQVYGSSVTVERDAWRGPFVANPSRPTRPDIDARSRELSFRWSGETLITNIFLVDEISGVQIDSITIDRAGQSRDYTVSMEIAGDVRTTNRSRYVNLRVHGLTGIVEEIAD